MTIQKSIERPSSARRVEDGGAHRPPTPILLVVVDTEEEFDWNAPLSRENTTVREYRLVLKRIRDN